jgi:hypothetical protein
MSENKQCFGEGTSIMLFDGSYKEVEKLTKNDVLIGPNNTFSIIKTLFSGEDYLYKIIDLDYNYVYKVTENKVLTLINSKNKIIDITLKDFLEKKKKHIYYGFRVMVDYKNTTYTNKEITNYVDDLIEKINNNKKIEILDRSYIYNSIQIRYVFLSYFILKMNKYKIFNGNIVFYIPIFYVKLIDNILFLCYSLLLNPTTERENDLVEITINTCTSSFFSYIDSKVNEDYLDILEDDSISTYNIKIIKERKKNKYYGFELEENNRFILWDSTVSHGYKN